MQIPISNKSDLQSNLTFLNIKPEALRPRVFRFKFGIERKSVYSFSPKSCGKCSLRKFS